MQKLVSVDYATTLLKKYGIETPKQKTVNNTKDFILACNEIGFPLFMKIDSSEISHKTDLGLVAKAFDIKQALGEYKRIIEASQEITKNINGILVQEIIDGSEFIMGIKNDSVFGKVIMFGTGGIYTEIFKDVSFRICPIDTKEALKMIQETKGFDIMHARGKNVSEIKIANILSSLSQLAVKENIEGLDINPFIAGEKYSAVDVKIIK